VGRGNSLKKVFAKTRKGLNEKGRKRRGCDLAIVQKKKEIIYCGSRVDKVTTNPHQKKKDAI